jgi:hypothetical protein
MGTNSKSKSLSRANTMGLGHEKLDVYRLSVILADSAEKATTWQRVPQPAEQNWLLSIPKMRRPSKRRHVTALTRVRAP